MWKIAFKKIKQTILFICLKSYLRQILLSHSWILWLKYKSFFCFSKLNNAGNMRLLIQINSKWLMLTSVTTSYWLKPIIQHKLSILTNGMPQNVTIFSKKRPTYDVDYKSSHWTRHTVSNQGHNLKDSYFKQHGWDDAIFLYHDFLSFCGAAGKRKNHPPFLIFLATHSPNTETLTWWLLKRTRKKNCHICLTRSSMRLNDWYLSSPPSPRLYLNSNGWDDPEKLISLRDTQHSMWGQVQQMKW